MMRAAVQALAKAVPASVLRKRGTRRSIFFNSWLTSRKRGRRVTVRERRREIASEGSAVMFSKSASYLASWVASSAVMP